jgi:hypothetical protein
MDFPSGAPGPATAPAPGQQPLDWEPLGPNLVQLNPRAHRAPLHLPRSRLPSRPDRADSDTLDIRFVQLRSRTVLAISGSLHGSSIILCKIHPAQHGIHPLLFWIRLLQIALQIFQPVTSSTPILPLIIVLDNIPSPFLVLFCISHNIQICVYSDDIILVIPDDSDIDIDNDT